MGTPQDRRTSRLLPCALLLLIASDSWSQIITTVAGTGECCFWGDGGPATRAALGPGAVFVDASGHMYIADTANERIRRVDAATGIITTVAGTGVRAFSGDGGPAIEADLLGPTGVFVDGAGHLYIAEVNRIRRVDAATGIITTVAGRPGEGSFSGDGGPAIQAHLLGPFGVVVDEDGHLYIADHFNNRIRRVDGVTGIITTVAGTGEWGSSGDGGLATQADLQGPTAVSLDADGNLYIADSYNHRIRRVDGTTGVITTVAGPEGLLRPEGVFVGSAGTIYITDTEASRVLRVDAAGTLSTVAGTGDWGFSGDGGPATQARLNYPRGVFVDSGGHVYIADTNNRRVRRVDAAIGVITTIAGGGKGDGIPATEASLYQPFGVFVDRAANLFIADWGNHRIRRVDGATGIITTVAGTGEGGLSGDGGPATHGRLDRPTDTFVDEAGNIYIADNGNRRIRRVDAVTGIITTMAGTTEGFSGDGGPATEARLSTLSGLSVDREGNLFIADSGNHRIRRVDAATGIITTVAGTGEGPPPVIDKPASRTGVDSSGDGGPATQANISVPDAVSVDDAGNLYIADTGNLRIRRVDAVTGIITTVAGTGEIFGPLGDGAPATEASLQDPSGVFVDGSGNLYIADTLNQRIRRVDAVTGVITTVAGTGERGFSGDGGPATRARLDRPVAVFVDGAGDLYFADNWNNRVRKVTIPSTSVADGMTPDQTATAFALAQNYPNPFNPTTRILYQLAQSGPVSLAIYDLLGQRIRILVQEQQVAGAHQVAWDGTDATGHDVAAGIYVYRLATPQGILARRMMRLK